MMWQRKFCKVQRLFHSAINKPFHKQVYLIFQVPSSHCLFSLATIHYKIWQPPSLIFHYLLCPNPVAYSTRIFRHPATEIYEAVQPYLWVEFGSEDIQDNEWVAMFGINQILGQCCRRRKKKGKKSPTANTRSAIKHRTKSWRPPFFSSFPQTHGKTGLFFLFVCFSG